MGGHGPRMPIMKDVWVPTGGPYGNAKNSRRNFFIAFGLCLASFYPVFLYGERRTVYNDTLIQKSLERDHYPYKH
ncbi:isoleucine tRS [Acrasis kona]|uniref:Isoleucine tRS n=1 Tax=Acrasis kona TaxID=1008807 RepID=A0AAW2ZK32_9EUKA